MYVLMIEARLIPSTDHIQEEEGSQMIEDILRKQNQFEVPRIPERAKFLTWPLYMLDVFRILRAADKKSWHHRIVNRVSTLQLCTDSQS